MSSYAESGRAPRTLTEREQRLVLKVTGEHRAGFRDHVLYAMALGTGLREHELVALDVGDVFDTGGKARRRIVLRVFKGADRTSGGQDVLAPEGLRAKLNKLRDWKVRGRESVEADAPLFVSRLGQRLSLRQVRHGFRVWQERADFARLMERFDRSSSGWLRCRSRATASSIPRGRARDRLPRAG